jgi:hypothetical protein
MTRRAALILGAALVIVAGVWLIRNQPAERGAGASIAASPPPEGRRPQPIPEAPAVTRGIARQEAIAPSSWKTYRSETYGYAIDYPEVSRVSSPSGSSTTTFEFVESFNANGNAIDDELNLEVVTHRNTEQVDTHTWAERHLLGPDTVIRDKGDIRCGELPGYRLALWETDAVEQHVILSNGPWLYELTYVDPSSASLAFPEALRLKYEEVFAHMLQSFHVGEDAHE